MKPRKSPPPLVGGTNGPGKQWKTAGGFAWQEKEEIITRHGLGMTRVPPAETLSSASKVKGWLSSDQFPASKVAKQQPNLGGPSGPSHPLDGSKSRPPSPVKKQTDSNAGNPTGFKPGNVGKTQ